MFLRHTLHFSNACLIWLLQIKVLNYHFNILKWQLLFLRY